MLRKQKLFKERFVFVFGDERPCVFSQSRNGRRVYVSRRFAAAQHAANTHQRASAAGNAWEVYLRSQCDITAPPTGGVEGEEPPPHWNSTNERTIHTQTETHRRNRQRSKGRRWGNAGKEFLFIRQQVCVCVCVVTCLLS